MQLTQKETSLLKDLKSQEEICVKKYNDYACQAHDGQLKGLLSSIGQVEQQHLDTINQIMGGTIPQMNSGGGGGKPQLTFTPTYNMASTDPNKQKDAYLCSDLLSTEKHVSSVYDTAIFEFKNTQLRDILNHIQKEEQEHGEQIYNYMEQNGMYS